MRLRDIIQRLERARELSGVEYNRDDLLEDLKTIEDDYAVGGKSASDTQDGDVSESDPKS